MVAALLRMLGLDVRREVRQLATTLILALAGAAALVLTVVIALAVLFVYVEGQLGTLAALGIVGGLSAITAAVLLSLAFLRGQGRGSGRESSSALAMAQSAAARQTSATADAIAAAEHALNTAADKVSRGSRTSAVGTILIAALTGWILGRRL